MYKPINKVMRNISIIKVPVANVDRLMQICFELRGEKYYLAYETDITKQYSVLFPDLEFIKKHFSVEHNGKKYITKDSLNEGRLNLISDYKRCIKAGVPMWELGCVTKDGNIKISPETGEPYRCYKLTDSGKKQFQKEIDKGLIVLCELV